MVRVSRNERDLLDYGRSPLGRERQLVYQLQFCSRRFAVKHHLSFPRGCPKYPRHILWRCFEFHDWRSAGISAISSDESRYERGGNLGNIERRGESERK